MIPDAPISGLLDLWGHLIEAYHGVHSFGSTTAEVYAYTLQARSPSADAGLSNARALSEASARTTLEQVIARFEERYGCCVYVEGTTAHRWHLTVKRK